MLKPELLLKMSPTTVLVVVLETAGDFAGEWGMWQSASDALPNASGMHMQRSQLGYYPLVSHPPYETAQILVQHLQSKTNRLMLWFSDRETCLALYEGPQSSVRACS